MAEFFLTTVHFFFYIIMNPNNKEYDDYSALDAPDHLIEVLDQFFQRKQNTYKFALAKKHFDHIVQQDSFIEANRIFKVITGTDLITKKHVLHYRTAQGMRYLIKKEYAQSTQRNIRNARRTKNKDGETGKIVSTTHSPFVQLMSSKTPIDDSSSDESTIEPKEQKTSSPSTTEHDKPIDDSQKSVDLLTDSTKTTSAETPFQSDLTKHAEELEKDMDSAMADLKDPEPPQGIDDTADTLEAMISEVINGKLETLLHRLDKTEQDLRETKEKYKSLQTAHNELSLKHDELRIKHSRMHRQVNFNSRAVEVVEERLTPLETSKLELAQLKVTVQNMVETQEKSDNKLNDTINDTESVHSIITTQDKVQRRLLRLKEGTKKMFKSVESDYDIITDRIHRLETTLQNMTKKNRSQKSTQRKLNYDEPSDSDSSSFSSLPPTKSTTPTYVPNHTVSDTPYRNTYYRGPNIDYLRKNVNITCSEQNQILEFYIKFRLALQQGGIHILPIEQISKHKSIAQDSAGITTEDQRLQSNALFTLLSKEKIIPSDFTMAQNCIQGYASTMDGFGALRAMLKLIHPTLSKKRPSNVPPVLSDSSDIHSYEQNLRNFYLLHKLFSDIDFPPIEKAKQFLQGMDDGQYSEAVQRVQHQLDTFESLKVPLTEDFNIDNIASTIINISSEYENTKTVVNTMRQNHRNYSTSPHHYNNNNGKRQSLQYNSNQRNSPRYRSEKFEKAQCFACKQFGHTVTHCRLLPKVLAIMQFQSKYGEKCDRILKQHIHNNTIDSKRVFVRTLQNMNLLSHTDDCDSYLENDMIVHTLTDNGINHDEFHSDEE